MMNDEQKTNPIHHSSIIIHRFSNAVAGFGFLREKAPDMMLL
jgi:hypothetical protein